MLSSLTRLYRLVRHYKADRTWDLRSEDTFNLFVSLNAFERCENSGVASLSSIIISRGVSFNLSYPFDGPSPGTSFESMRNVHECKVSIPNISTSKARHYHTLSY